MARILSIDEQALLRFSTSIPDSACSSDLAQAVRMQVRDELNRSVASCGQKLGADLSKIRSNLEKLSLQKRWSPELFTLHHALPLAMKGGLVTEIMDLLMRLRSVDGKSWESGDDIRISSILESLWERDYVGHLREYEQKNIRGESTIVRPIIDDATMKLHAAHIEQALTLIAAHDPELHQEIRTLVTDIKIFQGRVLRGDTSPRTFGAMWLRIPEPEDDQVGYWVEHIIHEVSHSRLAAVGFFDPVVLNPVTERKFRAPIRDDPRPMLGIFHASFVLARMVRVFRRMSLAGFDKRFRDRLQLCRLQFERGLETLAHPEARFTASGEAIHATLTTCAEG